MKKFFSNCNDCGKLMIIIGLLVATPLIVLPFYPEDRKYALAFFLPSLGSIILGFFTCFTGNHKEDRYEWKSSIQYSSLTVLFAWFWGILIGALPFVICNQLSFVQAVFEAVSGWTTTGLSVIDVTKTSHIFLFHRSFMQFCGGLGFVMMMVMLIHGKQSMNLYNAEGHPDKLLPNLKKTAQIIFIMYNGFLIVGTIAYILAGMNLFDGICHAMCSLSTGGFSTKLNSIGEYNSLPIEIVTIVLMLIGTTNFAVLLLLSKGKWIKFFQVSEVRFMFILLLIFIPITAISLSSSLNISFLEGLRRASFDVASALSTSGYSSMSYTTWPPLAIGILILMMLIGGGLGSTAGGIKLTRVYLMLRLTYANIRKKLLSPRKIETLYYTKAQGKSEIDNALIIDTTGFISCYMIILLIGTLLITATANCSLTEAMFEFSSALGTVGLSIGITSPTTNAGTLIIEIFGMILGRLEIFIVLTGIGSGITLIKQYFTKNANIYEMK